MRPTIITVAVTGNHTRRDQHPELPVTPEEIAAAAISSADEGAAIAHIHVRHADGTPSMELDHYRDVMERIRASGRDIILNLTTGPGGRFVPDDRDPKIAAPGTTLLPPAERIRHVLELRPEICTLDLNTMWFGNSVVINTPRNVAIMAEAIRGAGVKPELEVFDSGDIRLAHSLIAEGLIAGPPMFQIVTGVRYGFAATPETMTFARSLLPAGCQWAGFGIGRMSFPMVAQSFLLGGHVRVGLEDTVHIEKGILAPSNAAMVAKAARIVRDLGGSIATPTEARALLGLTGPWAS